MKDLEELLVGMGVRGEGCWEVVDIQLESNMVKKRKRERSTIRMDRTVVQQYIAPIVLWESQFVMMLSSRNVPPRPGLLPPASCLAYLVLFNSIRAISHDSYLLAGADKSLVFQFAEHVPQKVFVQLGVFLLQDNLLQLQRKVVCVAAFDVALKHVMCDEPHGAGE